jgi:hypothetical protein
MTRVNVQSGATSEYLAKAGVRLLEMDVARDQLVIGAAELTCNIWSLTRGRR